MLVFFKIDIALYKNCRVNIREALRESVAEIDEKEVTLLWEKALAILSHSLIEDAENESVVELRASRKYAEHVIQKSTAFLHEQYNWLFNNLGKRFNSFLIMCTFNFWQKFNLLNIQFHFIFWNFVELFLPIYCTDVFSYNNYMETIVEGNLAAANRGGMPGTIPLVEAYLNVQRITYQSPEVYNTFSNCF